MVLGKKFLYKKTENGFGLIYILQYFYIMYLFHISSTYLKNSFIFL